MSVGPQGCNLFISGNLDSFEVHVNFMRRKILCRLYSNGLWSITCNPCKLLLLSSRPSGRQRWGIQVFHFVQARGKLEGKEIEWRKSATFALSLVQPSVEKTLRLPDFEWNFYEQKFGD